MNNKYGRFLVLFFALGIAVFIGGSAQAATCNVPSGLYPTIQSAVNDLSCDPIVVAGASAARG